MTLPLPPRGTARQQARTRTVLLVLIGVAFVAYLGATPPEGLDVGGYRAIGVLGLCTALWVTALIPLVITSLLAMVLLPVLGVMSERESFALFGNRAVFFILGAFILASGVHRSGLSRRFALAALDRFGTSSKRLVAATFLLPFCMSFFMSEHAVAAMMFPIVSSLCTGLHLRPGQSRLGRDLFLALAHGSIIGGVATLLGGARGPLALGILEDGTGETISFMMWIAATLPIVLGVGGLALLLRLRGADPSAHLIEAHERLHADRLSLGPPSRREIGIGVLLAVTVASWAVLGEEVGLASIALLAVVVGFVFGLMRWEEVESDVNWGIFLMYGGAVALGHGLAESGAVAWIAERVLSDGWLGPTLVLPALSGMAMVMTEAVSNSAVVAMLLPLGLGVGEGMDIAPTLITLVVAVPTGLAFILPMSTPAVAMTRGSGYVRGRDLLRAGIPLALVGWILVNLCARLWWPLLGFSG